MKDVNNKVKQSRRGRPEISDEVKKSEMIGLKLTKEEYQKIKQIAFDKGIKMGQLFLQYLPEILGEDTRGSDENGEVEKCKADN